MGDKSSGVSGEAKASGSNTEKATAEPQRSRWTPKPEQILILESIFNSGMVNPPKDETVRIRKLLEKFGAVGDANVFYWFQNRRSRSRRRQRQLQAGLLVGGDPGAVPSWPSQPIAGGAIPFDRGLASTSSTLSSSNSSGGGAFMISSSIPSPSSSSSSNCSPSTAPMVIPTADATNPICCSSGLLIDDGGADDLFSISRQMGFPGRRGESTGFAARSEMPDFKYQSGLITIFINGVPWEVPRGPFDTRAVFGNDAVLVRSSGDIVPVDQFGILFQGLQMGESYFLVPRLC